MNFDIQYFEVLDDPRSRERGTGLVHTASGPLIFMYRSLGPLILETPPPPQGGGLQSLLKPLYPKIFRLRRARKPCF